MNPYLRSAGTLALATILLASPTQASKFYGDYGKAYFEPSERVLTPHIRWAKPLEGGPLRVLFITNHKSTRDIIELAQRLEMDYEVFTTELSQALAVEPQYLEVINTRPEDYQRRLREKLAPARQYELIVVANVQWGVLPESSRQEIQKRVESGCGLVTLSSDGLEHTWLEENARPVPITQPVDFSPFPYLALPRYRSQVTEKDERASVFMNGLVDIYELGQGRLAVIKGINPPARQMITPGYTEETLDVKMLNYDYHLSLAIRMMCWAAGRDRAVRIRATPSDRWCLSKDSSMDRANMTPIAFRLESEGQRSVLLELVVRDRDNEILNHQQRPQSLRQGDNIVRFELPPLPAGLHFVDLWAKSKGEAIIDFGTLALEIHSKTHLRDLILDSDNFEKEQPITGQITVVSPADDEMLVASQIDNFGRLTGRSTLKISARGSRSQKINFQVKANDTRSIRQIVRLQLIRDGHVLDNQSKAFSISDLYPRDDIRSTLFTSENGTCYTDILYAREIAKAGFDSVWANPDTRRMAPLASWGNLYRMPSDYGPGSAVDAIQTTAGPVRFACLTDPAVIEEIERGAIALAQHLSKFSNRDFSLASEGGYMRGHDDRANACFSPTCIKDFQQWLKQQYGTLDDLNAEYGTDHANWEDILPISRPAVPQPNAYREVLELPDLWKFQTDPDAVGVREKWFAIDADDSAWSSIRVGDFWERQGYEDYDGAAWYRLHVTLPSELAGRQLKLLFGAADEVAHVYVNGQLAGIHDIGPGGWDQNFEIDISDQVKAGRENLIAVQVIDTIRFGGLWKPIKVLTPKSPQQIADDTIARAELRAAKRKQLPQWVDHRRHMETVWAGFFETNTRAFRQIIPNARVGFQCSGAIGHGGTSYAAIDYWAMNQAMTLNCNYPGPFAPDAARDFIQPDSVVGTDCYGYSLNAFHLRWAPWRSLLRGANIFLVFRGLGHPRGGPTNTGNDMDMMAPDLSWYEGFRGSVRQQKEIKRGIGKLLMECKRSNDGIAVLYSASSTHVSECTEGLPKYADALRVFPQLFEDAGYQYQTISYQQVADGILSGGAFGALYLPYCQAISQLEAEAIKSFVASGGVLLADLRPGVTNEHGTPYSQGILDEVFGVSQQTDDAAPHRGIITINQILGEFQGRLMMSHSDASLNTTTGRAYGQNTLPRLLRMGWPERTCPVLIANDYGRGTAILFNFSLSDYGTDAGSSMRVQDFMQSVLNSAGVHPPMTLAPNIPGAHLYRFTESHSIYAGLLRNPAGMHVPGHDHGQRDIERFKAEQFTITLPQTFHLYDMREGKYLGFNDEIKNTQGDVTPFMLAALSYSVRNIELHCSRDEAEGGDIVNVRSKLITEGDEPVGLHVFHVEVLDPDGKALDYLSSNIVATNGECEFTIPFALNDKPGRWELMIRDVASGVTGTIEVRLRQKE